MTELIEIFTTEKDQNFVGGSTHWANGDIGTTFDDTTDLSLVASATGQHCGISFTDIGTPLVAEKFYRLQYDYTETLGSFEFKINGLALQVLGDAVAGTSQYIDFYASEAFTGAHELRIYSKTNAAAAGDFDNFSLKLIGTAVNSIFNIVENRLKLIAETNGYNYSITNIERAMMKPWKSKDLPAINYWSTGLDNNSEVYGSDERGIPLFIEVHTKTHDENFLDVSSKLAADIVTALDRAILAPKVSDSASHDLGGKVSDLIFEGYDHEIGEGQEPWCGVLVRFTIKYKTTIFNMTSYDV